VKELRFAIRHTIPIFFTYLFIGIAFGILMSDAGYSVLLSVLSAVLIYAGSMQIVMVPMMASGASLLSIALMTFFINARHIFYGIGFVERFRRMGWRYPYMIFSLTDETYSLLCSIQYEDGLDQDQCAFLIALLNHLYWIFGCFAGSCAGTYLQFDLEGFEFSAVAFFLVVVVSQWQTYRSKLPFLLGVVSAIGFYLLLGKEYFLIPTLVFCLFSMIGLRKTVEGKENTEHG
jgi:4-azaleucine resistance transporter AzlC